MPKQLIEINKFMNGTITTPDATDTPEQSATYSLNLDCVNKDGALQGAPINGTTIASGTNFDKCKIIKTLTLLVSTLNYKLGKTGELRGGKKSKRKKRMRKKSVRKR